MPVPNTTDDAARRFMTVKQVATELAVREVTVYSLVRSGELPAIQVGPKKVWRIERAKLEQYIADRYAAVRRTVDSGDLPPADEA